MYTDNWFTVAGSSVISIYRSCSNKKAPIYRLPVDQILHV